MKSVLIATAALALAVSAAPQAMAANARAPYKNVNHANDDGNNTGDSQIEQLNAAQLDQNYKGPYTPLPPASAVPPPPSGAMPYAGGGTRAGTMADEGASPAHRTMRHRTRRAMPQ